MIAELGHAALWLATALAVLQMIGGALGLRAGNEAIVALARPAAVVQAFLATLSFFLLLYAFAITDLSIKLVASSLWVESCNRHPRRSRLVASICKHQIVRRIQARCFDFALFRRR